MEKRKIYTKHKKISDDTLTPVQLYLKIRDEFQKPLLLESSEHANKKNDYSYICFEPLSTITFNEGICMIDGKRAENSGKINKALANYMAGFETNALPVPFSYNGLFGYTGYHAIPLHEEISFKNTQEKIPELFYALYQCVLVFDHYHDELYIFSQHFTENEAQSFLDKVKDILLHKPTTYFDFYTDGDEVAEITDNEYKNLVAKAKEHCQKGDVFQLVLSRKFSQKFKGDDFNVYRTLRNINPSPYLFYFDFGNFKLFGSSPESQVIVKNNKIIVHPIAGTVRRTGDVDIDQELAQKLKIDPKENAEHVMLVDLARNDISKHASNVRLNYYKELHQYSHVIHMVSEVEGDLKKEHKIYDVLLDTFPAGTLSGAPKYKAIELIHEYEKTARSFYGGSIGIIDFNNQINHAILIRSFLCKNNMLYYQAGAGIVLSSTEEGELQEVNNKINALRKAISHANAISINKK